jgi:hypothetical protein
MNEEMLFQQMRFIRNRTMAMLDATSEDLVQVIPTGFKNNVLWNFAHIYVTQDLVMYSFLNEKHQIPAHYMDLFVRGSSPEKWTVEPPSLAEVRTLLDEQPQRIIETFSGRLEEKGEKPFTLGPTTSFTTLGEIIGFTNFHEGLHQGTINGLKRALGVGDLWEAVER